MNICYINSYSCLGGAEKSLQSIILGIEAEGHNVIVIVGEDGPLNSWLKENKIKSYIIPQPSLKKKNPFIIFRQIIVFCLKMRAILKKNKIDIVHSNTLRSRLYSAFLSYAYQTKYVSHVRDIEYLSINKWLINRSNMTIGISDPVMNGIKYKLFDKNNSKIIKIHNGIKEINFSSPVNNDDLFKIGMFARFEEWKCHHIFVECAKELKKSNKNIVFYIYGDAIREAEKEYKKTVLSLIDNEDNIKYMGSTDNPQKEMSALDLIICPSDNEPFGRVLIESMSQKVQIITSSNGGAKEILGNYYEQLTFEPRNPVAISNLVLDIIDNKDKYKESIDYLYNRYCQCFSEAILIYKLSNLYNNIIEN